MRRLALALALLVASPAVAKDKKDINFGPMLHLIGRHGLAHACPIGPDVVVTSAHVIDIKPFDGDVPLFPYSFSTETQEGWVRPVAASVTSDIAIMEPTKPLDAYYPIATVRPKPGDKVFWVGYSYKRKEGLQETRFDATVVGVLAGHIIADEMPLPGSSGGCVLNENEEAVGIVSWDVSADDGKGFLVGPAVFSPWLDLLYSILKEKRDGRQEEVPHSNR
jgi:hypothetical protein